LLYRVLGRYRRVAHKNLALIYGSELDAPARRAMARAVFVHFGQAAAEFVKMPQLTRADVDCLAVVEGEEHLCRALETGKGVLLITGHYGNWEFMARWLSTHGYPLNVVARRANDPQADRLLMDTRTEGGAQVYNRGNSARAVLQCLKRKEIVALLPDQNAGNVFVPFCGKRTGTVDGPAILHLRTGAPMLFSWCARLPDNRFHILFEPPVEYAPTGDRNADILHVMTQVNARLEVQIRRHPTQWLWLHDRWKSSPGVFDECSIPEGANQTGNTN
jgi:KDO2-lipid IV(A) lauroyltransferase